MRSGTGSVILTWSILHQSCTLICYSFPEERMQKASYGASSFDLPAKVLFSDGRFRCTSGTCHLCNSCNRCAHRRRICCTGLRSTFYSLCIWACPWNRSSPESYRQCRQCSFHGCTGCNQSSRRRSSANRFSGHRRRDTPRARSPYHLHIACTSIGYFAIRFGSTDYSAGKKESNTCPGGTASVGSSASESEGKVHSAFQEKSSRLAQRMNFLYRVSPR